MKCFLDPLDFKQVLHLPSGASIDETEGYFDMGIDSIMAMELKNLLEKVFSMKLNPTLAFDFPSVSSTVKEIDRMLNNFKNEAKEKISVRIRYSLFK